ncbi:MAG: heparinase II/III family protein [Candidatus Woesearchaeota archaeon]
MNKILIYLTVFSIVCATSSFAQHPKLFFSNEEIPSLREKAATTHADIWDSIKTYADLRVSQNCPTYVSSCDNCNLAADTVFTLAFAFIITGEEKYLTKSKECLLTNANTTKWPYWDETNTRDLYLADMLMKNSIAYDWLYNNLTEPERIQVRKAIALHAQEMFEAADYNNPNWTTWWSRSFIQNHWTTNNAALGVAALAIEDEEGYNPAWLEMAKSQFEIEQYILENIGEGTWHEGYNYQNALFIPTLPFYINLERLKGVTLMPDNYFVNYIRWRAYNYLPSERPVFPIGSVVPDWGWNAGLHHVPLRYFASRYNNGTAEWLARQILLYSNRQKYTSYHAQNMVYEFFYYNASVQPIPPDLPLDAFFKDAGIVTWRTGWGDNELVFGFKSSHYGGQWVADAYLNNKYPFNLPGANANAGHDHPDANSFFLYKGAADLSSEKPHRQTWNQYSGQITTLYHNTVQVDGKNQYPCKNQVCIYNETYGRISKVLSFGGFSYLLGDATNMYRDMIGQDSHPGPRYIDEFTRRVLFVKPDYFVIVDNLKSQNTHKYEWVANIGPGGVQNPNLISIEGDWVKGTVDNNNLLAIKVVSPKPFAYETGISSFTGQGYNKAHIRIRPTQNVANTRFAMIVIPTTPSQWSNKPEIELLGDNSDGAGIRVGKNVHLFRYGAGTAIGNYTLNGEAAAITENRLFVINATLLSNSDVVFMQSTTPLTFEAIQQGSSLNIVGDGITGLTIRAIGVTEVKVNGESTNFQRVGEYVSLSGPHICGLADADLDQSISKNEINTYIKKWIQGDIPTGNIISAVFKWKNGC